MSSDTGFSGLLADPALLGLLRDLGRDPDELRASAKYGVPRPTQRLVAGDVIVELARTPQGALRLLREVRGRTWGERAGVAVPRVHGCGAGGYWMVAEWCAPQSPPRGEALSSYIDAVVEAARAIAAAPPPRGVGPEPVRWRSPRTQALSRTFRGLCGGMPLARWWAARRAVAELPEAPVAHGDYYFRNAPWSPARGVAVIDWEYSGPGVRHGDLLRFWSVLPHAAQRDMMLEKILDAVPSSEHRAIGTLARWFALRRLGENLKVASELQNHDDIEHAWSVLPEAEAVAAALA